MDSQVPRFTEQQAAALANKHFEVTADGARNLGSERDQTLLLTNLATGPVGVLKISNTAESTETLDMEALVVHHIAQVDPELPVAHPCLTRTATDPDAAASYRAGTDGRSGRHWLRLYPVLPGTMRSDPAALDDPALGAWGEITARLAKATRGFSHPAAHRAIPWDLQSVPLCRDMLPYIRRPKLRAAAEQAFDRYDQTVAPAWPMLRKQVIHGDLNIDNALVGADGRITGVIDFGDMTHTALITDLASVIDSLVLFRPLDDVFRVARLILDGYQRITPLEAEELRLISDAWAARAAAGLAIPSWRSARGLNDPEFAERDFDHLYPLLQHIIDTGFEQAAELVSGVKPFAPQQALTKRRAAALGPAMEALSYDEPLYVSRAQGTWLFDVTGRRYLDAYNNVPSVGHAHPRVTEAIARQSRLVNTHLRYLHPFAIELAERLINSCPPGLDTVLFVNSGTEANDLAWRIAQHVTGNAGFLCGHHAYHGISHAIAAVSPESLYVEPPAFVERWRPADLYRGRYLDSAEFELALARLADKGFAPAATIVDGVQQSDGVLVAEPDYVQELWRLNHDAGGLWIADEVQGGHGRTGHHLWSFERFGIEPDFVTLGKPMGNGHPVAAVITRSEFLRGFAEETVIFSTFGGNPVSAAAALAVLDVLADERVLPRVVQAGEALRLAISEIAAPYECVGDVRGVGLAIGIEIVQSRESKAPDQAAAVALRNAMKRHGVLIGATGPHGNVLKVRPPLAFTEREVPVFAEAFAASLRELRG
jgi:4-aminobutyrate aminotransferase-like enzyme/Ser/Thr protein kinase RdoA (MazF antagonist)